MWNKIIGLLMVWAGAFPLAAFLAIIGDRNEHKWTTFEHLYNSAFVSGALILCVTLVFLGLSYLTK